MISAIVTSSRKWDTSFGFFSITRIAATVWQRLFQVKIGASLSKSTAGWEVRIKTGFPARSYPWMTQASGDTGDMSRPQIVTRS